MKHPQYTPKVPLKVDNPTINGESVFVIWDDSAGIYKKHPRKPGFWCATPDGVVAEVADKRRLSDTSAEPSTWYRLEFDSWHDAEAFAKQRRVEGYGSYLGDVDRYSMRILAEDPAFFAGHPMKRPLRILAVDIEQRTVGRGFPAKDEPLVSIAFDKMDGSAPVYVAATDDGNGEPDDSVCLAAWRQVLEDYDPDIIVGYHVHYDVGVLAARGAIVGYPAWEWGRMDSAGQRASSYERQAWNPTYQQHESNVVVGGRIIWDLQANANATSDYNLAGCKDFKLKTIARFLGWPVVEEDTKNTLKVWRERPDDLERYNLSDVDLVCRMVHRYLPDRLALAEFFGAPLSMVVDVSSGWFGTIAQARTLFMAGIVADGNNGVRHKKYLKLTRERQPDGSFNEKHVKPEGAYVALHQRGLVKPVWKADYSSFYPNLIMATGAGPDNTRIVGTEPFGVFTSRRTGDVLRLSIPDKKYQHNWVIAVVGSSLFMESAETQTRDRIAAKKSGDFTRATILKTILNSTTFGANGSLHNKYGCLPVAIIAMGLARVFIGAVENYARDRKVETDTDGVYLNKPINARLLQTHIDNLARSYDLEPRLKLDLEDYPAAYFHEAKTYLLLTHNGTVLVHGSALKGKRHPAMFDKIVTTVGGELLRNGREAALAKARDMLDLESYELGDFVKRCTLKRPIESYKVHGTAPKVALAIQKADGTPPTPGMTYEYIETRGGVAPAAGKNRGRVDEYHYLRKVALTALERLGFTDHNELGVADKLALLEPQSRRPETETNLANYL